MHDEQTFRLILLTGSVLVFPIALYYRIRSQASREQLDRRQEGRFILFTLRPVGAIAMLGFVAYLIDPEWMTWSSLPLPAWLRWLGVGLGAVAAALLIWTMHTLGRNLTDTVVTRKEHTLVTHGPYRWVRHPFYCAAALAWVANSLATANWFLLLAGGLAIALIVLRTPTEEQNLLARFGDDYRSWAVRTGRFWPRIGAHPEG